MAKAVRSSFQFENPRITKLFFSNNKEYNPSEYNGMSIQYEGSNHRTSTTSAEIGLKIIVGSQDETTPFYIEADVASKFNWNSDFTEETIDDLLDRNGVLLLLSYVRPFITHIVVDAGYPPFVLPFIDLTKTDNE